MMGDLLGRLHALPYDDSASRPGGASGEDPSREGAPRQDLLAALSFLDSVDTKVAAADRERFERLRDKVLSADDGHGLPEGLLHGNLLHAPDHAVLSEQGPVAINWKASGRGPRLADFAYLISGTGRAERDRIAVLLTDDTDGEEIRELVTESYRILAPKMLTALLDDGAVRPDPKRHRDGWLLRKTPGTRRP